MLCSWKVFTQDVQTFDITTCSNDDDKGVNEIGSLDGRSYCLGASSYPIEHVVVAPSTLGLMIIKSKDKDPTCQPGATWLSPLPSEWSEMESSEAKTRRIPGRKSGASALLPRILRWKATLSRQPHFWPSCNVPIVAVLMLGFRIQKLSLDRCPGSSMFLRNWYWEPVKN